MLLVHQQHVQRLDTKRCADYADYLGVLVRQHGAISLKQDPLA